MRNDDGTNKMDRAGELVAMIAALGPAFRERAERYDREASFPYENFSDLRDAGFLALCIPESYGGLGADFAIYGLVAEELGRHCGSTALAFNMHTATCLLAGQIGDELTLSDEDRALLEHRRAGLFTDIVQNHTLHAQPFSEGLAPDPTKGFATTATPVDGGYRITGRKIFASLSTAADVHNVACMVEGDDQVHLIGVPAEADGVSITGDWDPLGMRGTISRTLIMEDVFVPEDNEWIPRGMFNQMAERWPHFYMTLSFAYLGVMGAIGEFTSDYLGGGIDGTNRSSHPQKQHLWGEMQMRHEQARALAYRALADAKADPGPEAIRRAMISVVTTMEGAPAMAADAIQACGGRSLLKTLPLERLYRDARCGATMLPWSVEVCRERLGGYGLNG
jgi:alkylation response protein AidB-like acyl-CoA dehydrogenase